MIDLLANLAFNLAPKTYQNSIQEASKINQKGYRRYDASWLGIWTPLATDLGGFLRQVGRQVGPKLAPKSGKLGSQDSVKKMIEKRGREELRETLGNSGKLGLQAPKNPSGISKTTIPKVPGTQTNPTTLHYRA